MSGLQLKYKNEIVPFLKKEFSYKSVMQAPKLLKICLNRGEGAAVGDKKRIVTAVDELTAIAGQKAVATLSKRAVSNFKLRENMPIGVRVTLRGNKMYDFLERLIVLALPRVRDFRGLNPKGFDKSGNYNLGIKESISFLEVDLESVQRVTGLNITFVISSNSSEESLKLLKAFGMPFRD